MKAIHVYPMTIEPICVSAVRLDVPLGDNLAAVHYSLKCGLPRAYWFSFQHKGTFTNFDVRSVFGEMQIPELEPETWLTHSAAQRLSIVAGILQKAQELGIDVCTRMHEDNWDIPF